MYIRELGEEVEYILGCPRICYCHRSSLDFYWFNLVAQGVDQWTENPRVGGSNPPPGTTELQK